MRALSPDRRLSITRNTFYPSVAQDRRPSELGNASQASSRSICQDFDIKRGRMEKLHSKSLSALDHQRKRLEKSMLAYTDKMKEMLDNRTNSLFRGIQIRVASKSEKAGPRSLPASVDMSDSISIPVNSAKLRNQRRYSRTYGIMSERGGINTPIEEERESDSKPGTRAGTRVRSISADTLRRAKKTRLNTEYNSMTSGVRYSSPNIIERPLRLPSIHNNDQKGNPPSGKRRKDISSEAEGKKENEMILTDTANEKDITSPNLSARKNSDDILTKPAIHIVADKTKPLQDTVLRREATFYPTNIDSASDSAYSSCTDDDEGWSTADESVTETGGESKTKPSVRFVEPNPLEGNLLTVPKVHKPKRQRKTGKVNKTNRNNKENLLRKTILKNANSSQENLSVN